jgi:predicted negative regulator of RcsB-dependent stress response
MSTIGYSSWAVDLKDVGAIYPFQGTEVIMVVLGVVFWIGWHVLQIRQEEAEIAAEMKAEKRDDAARKLIDDY